MGRAPRLWVMGKPPVFRWAAAGVLVFFLVVGKGSAQAGASVETRTAAIEKILADYRGDQLKREPELASLNGDKRFDDQVSDFSVAAANSTLSRDQTYIQRLSEIDMAGLPAKTRQSAEKLLNGLIDAQTGDEGKAWQKPLEQFARFHTQMLSVAEKLVFAEVKDFDDYIARLKKLPVAFSQIMTNVQLASDAGRPLPKAQVDVVLADVQAVVSTPAEMSPFLAPLKRFPAGVTASDRKRIAADLLDTVTIEVIPGYQRVGRFVAARAGSGAGAVASP